MNPAAIDLNEIRNANPDAIVLDSEQEGVVHTLAFRRPQRPDVNLVFGGGGAKFSKNAHNFVMNCLIAPDRGHATALFERYPGLPIALAGQLLEVAGLKEADLRPLS
jgi:hypothetical protein